MLGSAPTQTFRAEEPAVGAAKTNLAERTWDLRVADLQQRAAASLLGRSEHGVSDARGLSRLGLRQKHGFFHAVQARPGYSPCLSWLAYTVLPNVDLDMGSFGIYSCNWKIIFRKCLYWKKRFYQKSTHVVRTVNRQMAVTENIPRAVGIGPRALAM